ncbi:Imm27 family immunity protein [Colwellia sp. BRX9-1]|jgi:hypothetical protein|uniref:Imm27 family immunity protein n=1 Tax=Colwellia sp. BRX9-1 TaxID=2759830 RepID=UPI0015F6D371|nr:Imm27 family immunity protein [Colwellia sp. BRX9-1]MBA6354243.1 hypothetical protein [Colwellia sp. BRX9-1]
MDLLQASESLLTGRWLESGKDVIADPVRERIEWLINHNLKKVGTSKCGWNICFTDPIDGRFWLLTYLQSDMHGGGPPTLRVAETEEVKSIVTV